MTLVWKIFSRIRRNLWNTFADQFSHSSTFQSLKRANNWYSRPFFPQKPQNTCSSYVTSPANCTTAQTIIYLFFRLVWSSARDLKLSSSAIVSSPCAKRLQFCYFMLILMFKLYPFKLNVYLLVVFFIADVRADVSTMRLGRRFPANSFDLYLF